MKCEMMRPPGKCPTPRTSITHPLQIAVVRDRPFRGELGVTFAPGKTDPTASPAPWARDLASDLDVIVTWRAWAVVSLIEPHEFEFLAISTLGDEICRRGLEWFHLPIRDVSVPDAQFEKSWPKNSAALRAMLRTGDNVLVHCRGGLGRAGMVAARLLIEEGVEPDVAIKSVRAVRPGAIETRAQERWVRLGRRQS